MLNGENPAQRLRLSACRPMQPPAPSQGTPVLIAARPARQAHPSEPMTTIPFDGRPVISNGRAPGSSLSARCASSPPTRRMRSERRTPQHILPPSMKVMPPNILRSVTPEHADSAARTRAASVSSNAMPPRVDHRAAAASSRSERPLFPCRAATTSAMIASAISPGSCEPMSRPMGACTRSSFSWLTP